MTKSASVNLIRAAEAIGDPHSALIDLRRQATVVALITTTGSAARLRAVTHRAALVSR
jgi:hypothetical protein